MSSYYPSFNYMGLNSLNDKKLMVVAFEADQGESDAFLGMDSIYTEKYDGSKRIDYGAKFNSVAVIKISVIKTNKKDFTVAEVRDFLKWTTGARKNSSLDLLIGDEIKFSFIGRVTKAYQQKQDARTIGLSIEFTSSSPWAYSPEQYHYYSSGQTFIVDDSGTFSNTGRSTTLKTNDDGVLYNTQTFSTTDDGVVCLDSASNLTINNESDDLYTPVYLNVMFENGNSSSLSIINHTLDEETNVKDLSSGEVITLSENQFILSDKPNKIFGDSFNFVWPKLAPGVNNLEVNYDGSGNLILSYRYPIKIGDCAIDIDGISYVNCDDIYEPDDNTSSGNGSGSGNSGSNTGGDSNVGSGSNTDNGSGSGGGSSTIVSGKVSWENVINKPTTLSGYGITNAYTKAQVDDAIEAVDISIDAAQLNSMLDQILN